MHAFKYHKPASLAAAQAVGGDDTRFLAGGQSLVAGMKLRLSQPSDVVDLAGLAELRGIKADASAVTIGAMARHGGFGVPPEEPGSCKASRIPDARGAGQALGGPGTPWTSCRASRAHQARFFR